MSPESPSHINLLEVSLRRSGSTTLYRSLLSHPEIDGPSEPFSMHTRNIKGGGFDTSDPFSPIVYQQFHGDSSTQLEKMGKLHPIETWFFRHILAFYQSCSPDLPKVRLIKETFIPLQSGLILNLIPQDTYVLDLRRDPRAIIESYKSSGLFTRWNIPGLFSQVRTSVMSNTELRDRYAQLVNVDENKTPWSELIARKIILFRRELDRNIAGMPNQLKLDFEDFLRDTVGQYMRVMHWLGVDVQSDVLSQVERFTSGNMVKGPKLLHPLYQKRTPYDWVLRLTNQEIDSIERICESYDFAIDHVLRDEVRLELQEQKQGEVPNNTFERRNVVSSRVENREIPNRESVIKEIGGQMVLISSDKPEFYFGKYEISNFQFASFLSWLDRNGIDHDKYRSLIYNPNRGRIKRDKSNSWNVSTEYSDHPVVSVTWLGALMFAKWTGFRLPTFYEWKEVFDHDGNLNDEIESLNYNQRFTTNTIPVHQFGSKSGFCNIVGNVREWTSTFISGETVSTPGGSWQDSPLRIVQQPRGISICGLTENDLGFRLASNLKDGQVIEEAIIASRIKSVLEIISQPQPTLNIHDLKYEEIEYILSVG